MEDNSSLGRHDSNTACFMSVVAKTAPFEIGVSLATGPAHLQV